MSGRTKKSLVYAQPGVVLQWRAGQLSGRTRGVDEVERFRLRASMGGRAIVRPNTAKSCLRCQRSDRFNGGPGNCPAEPVVPPPCVDTRTRFNGGPGNCPAEPVVPPPCVDTRTRFNGGPGNCPAEPVHTGVCPMTRFNGGPGNCPAERNANQLRTLGATWLQWRAGQLSGRTRCSRWSGRHRSQCFNGGPGNCPAEPHYRFPLWTSGGCFNGGPGNCPAEPAK